MKAVEFRGVWERYRIKFVQKRDVLWEEFWALQDINFAVKKGEVMGVIGENGAGKTTLLKLIAGMLVSDRGEVYVQGKVSALMELGAGFNPEFTGRENIILNARMYGLDEDLLEQKMNEIIEFAGLGKFIDAPIRYYSQGMYMRLAFALAIFAEPEILLIDDILAVGDEEAQQKCIRKVFQLKQAGKTIVVVSHDMNMIVRLCDRVILLENGRIAREGLPQKVIPYYLETVGDKKGIAILEKDRLRVVFNNGRISLSCNDYFLTKGMGAYISYFIPSINSWSSSLNLSWQIKSFFSDRLVAEGRSQEGSLSQIWVLQLGQGILRWQVEMKELAIRQPHIDLVFMPQYKKWMTLDKNGDFPIFAYKSDWQDLGLNNCPDGIVGISPQEDTFDLPGLIFEIAGKDKQVKLLNTGYEQEARIIQVYLSSKNFAIDTKIFSQRNKFEDYIESIRGRFLLRRQAQEARQRARCSLRWGQFSLFADLEAKTLRLYYQDKLLRPAYLLFAQSDLV
jgi:ABC-type polysaccharide/polyol phosphate transport system ATPase subunit